MMNLLKEAFWANNRACMQFENSLYPGYYPAHTAEQLKQMKKTSDLEKDVHNSLLILHSLLVILKVFKCLLESIVWEGKGNHLTILSFK